MNRGEYYSYLTMLTKPIRCLMCTVYLLPRYMDRHVNIGHGFDNSKYCTWCSEFLGAKNFRDAFAHRLTCVETRYNRETKRFQRYNYHDVNLDQDYCNILRQKISELEMELKARENLCDTEKAVTLLDPRLTSSMAIEQTLGDKVQIEKMDLLLDRYMGQFKRKLEQFEECIAEKLTQEQVGEQIGKQTKYLSEHLTRLQSSVEDLEREKDFCNEPVVTIDHVRREIEKYFEKFSEKLVCLQNRFNEMEKNRDTSVDRLVDGFNKNHDKVFELCDNCKNYH